MPREKKNVPTLEDEYISLERNLQFYNESLRGNSFIKILKI